MFNNKIIIKELFTGFSVSALIILGVVLLNTLAFHIHVVLFIIIGYLTCLGPIFGLFIYGISRQKYYFLVASMVPLSGFLFLLPVI